jgi:hypothetical protein
MNQGSLFSQLLHLFNRGEFAKLVRQHKTDRYAKGFTTWSHFVSMLFCQVAQAKSLREICFGLATACGKLKHLGLSFPPNKSTLSYENKVRSWIFFKDLFYQTLSVCRSAAPQKHHFRFKNKLLTIDSTTISLCLSLFPWARFRRTKGAVKLHLLLDHDGYLPSFALVTEASRHDVKVLRQLSFAPGSIIVHDRGYDDYYLYYQWTIDEVFFVTRLKDNALFDVIEEYAIPAKGNILSDQKIRFSGLNAQKKCPIPLRRIVIWDEKNSREIVILTNHFEFAATTIALIYKDRWQIELFFKALKQNLKVKTFVGTTENALQIQIWTALIAMLLVKFLQFKSKFGWSLSNLVALLHWSLFTHRDLWAWLDNPSNVPPLEPEPVQYSLFENPIGQHP